MGEGAEVNDIRKNDLVLVTINDEGSGFGQRKLLSRLSNSVLAVVGASPNMRS